MKTFLIRFGPVVVALWIGYSLGYRHGARDNEAVWDSRLRVGPGGKLTLAWGEVTTISGHQINAYPYHPGFYITNQ